METMNIITGKEASNTKFPELSYKYDDKYFTICETENGKTRELYWFERDRCKTQWEQFDWLHQVLTKTWMTDTFNFVKAFHEAINNWYNISITDKESQ